MANTYSQIYLQIIFAVNNRESLIQKEWKDELYMYITGIIKQNNHKLIAINGISNHIHIFIGYKPHQLIPELVQAIKRCSSKWINERKFTKYRFSWQLGYGVFSYSHSSIPNVARYIENQEEHHRKKTFKEEYVSFLKEFDIQYDDRYILKEIK